MVQSNAPAEIYQLHILLLQINPPIWAHRRICSKTYAKQHRGTRSGDFAAGRRKSELLKNSLRERLPRVQSRLQSHSGWRGLISALTKRFKKLTVGSAIVSSKSVRFLQV